MRLKPSVYQQQLEIIVEKIIFTIANYKIYKLQNYKIQGTGEYIWQKNAQDVSGENYWKVLKTYMCRDILNS